MQYFNTLSTKSKFYPSANYFPKEVISEIFLNFPMERDLQRLSQVCHQWKKHVDQLNNERDSICEKYGIFGVKEWKKLNVKIGNVPRFNKKILLKLSTPIPIKKNENVPICILCPSKVDDKIFDIKEINKVFKNILNESRLSIFITNNCKANSTPAWLLITPYVVSNTGSYSKDKKFVEEFAHSSEIAYSIPSSFEMTLFSVVYYVKCKKFVLPVTCSNTKKEGRAFVSALFQEFWDVGFEISTLIRSDHSFGVCLMEKFY